MEARVAREVMNACTEHEIGFIISFISRTSKAPDVEALEDANRTCSTSYDMEWITLDDESTNRGRTSAIDNNGGVGSPHAGGFLEGSSREPRQHFGRR